MRRLILGLALVASAGAAQKADPQAEVMAAMTASAAGWNAGDLDRFVAIYAPDAGFVTKDGVLNGRPAIADRYRPSFTKGGNVRGTLRFQAVAYRTISATHRLLFARWTLTPAAGTPQTGLTTLVFERRREGWKIIADHSS
ncbi:hypothetical protein ASE75_07015 [Sphingomonas sp. Leaf17]|uniref:YybH family protein n=1 Tax=Sphingomonas sp. Leaf17 TaxID=1735683 RepID=UPI0006F96F43|nr:SgcJ/EcaC family oxidoreductase [Sphingomonas sp. Leaf17]KQM64836.1 hypothetical protein ASE75_07015 [Sphingomonas sp. Leaf17]